MRLSASLDVTLPGDVVLREPTSWERVQRLFLPASMAPELATEERLLNRDVVSLIEGLCTALAELEVNDAVYLAVDGSAVYYDTVGIPNDAEKLLQAAKADSFGQPFDQVRAVFTQRREGIDFLYEATFQRCFRQGTPAAVVSVCGRLSALRPQPGERVEEARARLHALLGDPELAPSLRAFFDDTVTHLQGSLSRAFPDGSTVRSTTTAFIKRPSRQAVRELGRRTLVDPRPTVRPQPGCYHPTGRNRPYYDPWDCYYYDVGETWIDLEVLSELLDRAWKPMEALSLQVVDAGGDLICGAAEAASHAADFTGLSELASQDFCVPHWEQLGNLLEQIPDASSVMEGASDFISSAVDLGNVDLGTSAIGDIADIGGSIADAIGEVASAIGEVAAAMLSSAGDYDHDD